MKPSRAVYVWQWPVRCFHWLNALCIMVLFLTGLYMGWPVLQPAGEAYKNFVLGWVRYIHFVTAYIMLALWILRIYWFFAGNLHARNLFRFWRRDAWASVFGHSRDLALASPRAAQELPGEDGLARLVHSLFFLAVVFIAVSGFALYGLIHPTGIPAKLTTWFVALFPSARTIVYWHHLAAWFFPLFALLHIYQVVRTDILARHGLVSSMISGFYHLEEKAVAQAEQTEETAAGD